MLELIPIFCALMIIVILAWPRPHPFERRMTKSFNGQGYHKSKEKY
jgi:hypothetical protein